MNQKTDKTLQETDALETQEWLESLDWVIEHGGHNTFIPPYFWEEPDQI